MAKKESPAGKFPTLAIILLIIGVVWLLNELKILTVNVPWWPLILIVIAIGMMYNRFKSK